MRRASVFVNGSVVAVALATTVAARAEPSLEPDEAVRIVYVAPAACPAEDAFVARLQARSRRVRLASASEPARTFAVRIALGSASRRVGGSAATGSFRVTTPEGETSGERVLESATCDEVVTAVALAAALTVESLPHHEKHGEGADSAASPIVTSPVPSSATPPVPSSATPPVRESPLASAPKSEPWALAIGAQGAVHGGVSPEIALAIPVFAELEAPWRSRSTLRLAFVRSVATSTALGPDGVARFTWTAGVADVCPRVFGAGSRFAFSPCARLEAGAVEGAAERITPARTEARSWMAVGAVFRLRVAITKAWFVETEAAARAPLVHDRFYVEPADLVFRPPLVAWSGGVGMGARFP